MAPPDRDPLVPYAVPDTTQLKALTHPVRLRMLDILRSEGPATASELARRLELNSGATSYHLRQLEKHGFIDEDSDRGNRRDRWWRASHTYTDIQHPGGDDDSSDAYAAAIQAVVTTQFAAIQRAVNELPDLDPEWRDRGTTHSDYRLHLTVGEAAELLEGMRRLIADARRRSEEAPHEPGRRGYGLQLHGHLLPGPEDGRA